MLKSNKLCEHFSPEYGNAETINTAFSVVVPVYNEEASVADTLDRLQEILKSAGCKYEIIVVNDGSTDRSGEILRSRRDIRLFVHNSNRGYGAALKTGIRHAKYPLIVITDADGTYPNERIPQLVAIASEADMVVGARIGANVCYSNFRKIPKWFLIQFAQWVTRCRIPDLNSGLRVFRKDIAYQFINILPDTFSFTTTITIAMLTNNYVVHYEPIDYRARVGKSKIKPIRDTLRFIQIILRTGVYFAPLRVFLPVAGIFFAGFLITLFQDIFIRENLTERTLILLVTSTQIGMFALLADMIDKRSSK
ncbi:MAG: glycosyltransferase family 2 protein [Oscillatoriaceae bacterium SKW80]|nr:glycosyltransferase family 2 protein [Oscillatoriaceae bacterium SKYG93]MCX8121629.1 glycosyltransferase family 2 protein [Oscillatoriaceae bacterium SKW80]MDW8453937.1 glycosyltransferase family 2 protein [Oscillatoriaceae cyanobacterium SKYGB_i_bin93]HIK28818.1 glycosyltransferase family 2 protein [Oscillatoriaceae cyanobacterium M7585_C2015_266]